MLKSLLTATIGATLGVALLAMPAVGQGTATEPVSSTVFFDIEIDGTPAGSRRVWIVWKYGPQDC